MIRSLTFRTDRSARSPASSIANAEERGLDGRGDGSAAPLFLRGVRWPVWYVRTVKRTRRAAQRLRAMLGLRRGVRVGGVWYKELTSTPMHRALQRTSRKGAGGEGGAGGEIGPHKDYRVTFADGGKLVIRCTPDEVYADLMGSVGLEQLYVLTDLIRPGSRVLELGAGSGYRAAWLGSLVGPSGSVVAIGHQREPVEYATRRYRLANVAFEVASPQSLSGETDGGFDAVLISTPRASPEGVDGAHAGGSVGSGKTDSAGQMNSVLEEAWRVLSPGGLLVLHAREAAASTSTGDSGTTGAAVKASAVSGAESSEAAPAAGPVSISRAIHRQIAAIHRKLGEPGRVAMPRTLSRVAASGTEPGALLLLGFAKPEADSDELAAG